MVNVRQFIQGMNPLVFFVEALVGFVAVLALITVTLMLPGIMFGLLPELMNASFWWAKDYAFLVVDNILPLWIALLLGLAVCVDVFLDILIFVGNVLGAVLFPPTYNWLGIQTGGWRNFPFNPLSGLIQQLYNFYQQMRIVAG